MFLHVRKNCTSRASNLNGFVFCSKDELYELTACNLYGDAFSSKEKLYD